MARRGDWCAHCFEEWMKHPVEDRKAGSVPNPRFARTTIVGISTCGDPVCNDWALTKAATPLEDTPKPQLSERPA